MRYNDLQNFIINMLQRSHNDEWSGDLTHVIVDALHIMKEDPFQKMSEEVFAEYLLQTFSYAIQVKKFMNNEHIEKRSEVTDVYKQLILIYKLSNFESPHGNKEDEAS